MSYLFYTAILLGVLVFVHELGHFLVAKLFDVKVLRFSIGFGPRIAGFKWGETEYIIGALPLGGYVQMLGMSFEQTEDVSDEDRGRALMMKPIWQRVLVTLAGPVFNLIFPIFLYFIVIVFAQSTEDPAQIGQAFGVPALAANLEAGDKIVEIDGEKIRYWHELTDHIGHRPAETFPLVYERDGKRTTVEITPEAVSQMGMFAAKDVGLIGISPITYGSTIAIEGTKGAAAIAGLKDFDTIIAINGKKVRRYDEVVGIIGDSKNKELLLDVLRPTRLDVDYAEIFSRKRMQISLTPPCDMRIDSCDMGLVSAEMTLNDVKKDSPAYAAGFRVGDRILAVNDKPFKVWFMAISGIHTQLWAKTLEGVDAGKKAEEILVEFDIKLIRDGEEKTLTLTPRVKNLEYPDFDIGFSHMRNQVHPDKIDFPIGDRIAHASVFSFTQTWDFTGKIFQAITRMFSGKISVSNLSGPIGIGVAAADAGKAGWDSFLQMMAVISINLALVNLIPIPLLDGGNLLLYALEAIKRGPLSFRTRQIATYIGFSFIIVLFILAFKNDIENNWLIFADWLNELF